MSTKSQNNKHSLEEESQGLGLYCDEGTIKKIDFIADNLHWSRSTLIIESIKHILNLIERFDNNIVPDFVIQARALQQANRCNFHLIKEPNIATEDGKIRTGCSLSPILLKKIDFIVSSIGYSRNSFISLCLVHTVDIIRDEQADPIPKIVKIARVCASKSIFSSGSIKSYEVDPVLRTKSALK